LFIKENILKIYISKPTNWFEPKCLYQLGNAGSGDPLIILQYIYTNCIIWGFLFPSIFCRTWGILQMQQLYGFQITATV
jgi:hypothetical protein